MQLLLDLIVGVVFVITRFIEVFIALTLFLLIGNFFISYSSQVIIEKDDVIRETQLVHSLRNIYGIKFPEVVACQIRHETGDFSSSIAHECNNIVGMKHPRSRKTLSIGICRGHARYASVSDCLKDYKLWQDRQLTYYESKIGITVTTNQQYIVFLEKINYATDVHYTKHLQRYLSELHKTLELQSSKQYE